MRLLFIYNTRAGDASINWPVVITDYFKPLHHHVELYHLPPSFGIPIITKKIEEFSPELVIAVGGDGTVKALVACLIKLKIPMGILPAGSANGLAKELHIPGEPSKALEVILHGVRKKIHVVKVNHEYCIHLSDIGLNAYAIKEFEKLHGRGMWGYLRASLAVLFKSPLMKVEIHTDDKTIQFNAVIVVIANATRYGTGALINPLGTLEDDLFEVIVIKKISLREIFKMIVTHTPYDTNKTEIFQTHTLTIYSKRKVHFQVDGEYLGKVHEVKANIIPNVIEMIVP